MVLSRKPKVSRWQWRLGECLSRQVSAWQEVRVLNKDATNVEWQNTKTTGFLSINSSQSKEQKEVLYVISCRRQITDATRRSKAKAAQKVTQITFNKQDAKITESPERPLTGFISVQTADEIVASYSEVFKGSQEHCQEQFTLVSNRVQLSSSHQLAVSQCHSKANWGKRWIDYSSWRSYLQSVSTLHGLAVLLWLWRNPERWESVSILGRVTPLWIEKGISLRY